MLPRIGQSAVDFANSIHAWPRSGLCLNFTRTCVRVAAMQNAHPPGGTAKIAWDRAKYKHTSRNNIPLGAPVFFFGLGVAEHITLYVGHDRVRSTDFPGPRQVTSVDIDELERRWNCYFKGWTEDLNGVRVVPQVKVVDPVRLSNLKRGQRNQDVLQFKRAAHRALGTKPSGKETNLYGKHAVELSKKLYKKWGWHPSDPGTPGPRMLQRLGLHVK